MLTAGGRAWNKWPSPAWRLGRGAAGEDRGTQVPLGCVAEAKKKKSYPIKRKEFIQKPYTKLQSFIQNIEWWGGLSVLRWLLINLISLKDLATWSCRKLLPQWIWCDRGRALRCTDRCLLQDWGALCCAPDAVLSRDHLSVWTQARDLMAAEAEGSDSSSFNNTPSVLRSHHRVVRLPEERGRVWSNGWFFYLCLNNKWDPCGKQNTSLGVPKCFSATGSLKDRLTNAHLYLSF